MIQVGTGGRGGWRFRSFLPPSVEDGLIEVVADFAADLDALRNMLEELRSGRYGTLDDLVMGFTCDGKKFGSWAADFRVEVPNPFMAERAVHHPAITPDIAGAECDTLYAQTVAPAVRRVRERFSGTR